MNLLANENFPRGAVEALRQAGHDVLWIRTECPGITDPEVLVRAVNECRVLLTFDKDFGELAFRAGLPSGCGVVLFRISMSSPAGVAARVVTLLASRTDWVGNFAVIDDTKIRVRALPSPPETDSPGEPEAAS